MFASLFQYKTVRDRLFYGSDTLAIIDTSSNEENCARTYGRGEAWLDQTTLPTSSGYVDLAYSPPLRRFVAISNTIWPYTDDFGATSWTSVAAGDDSARKICWSKTREEFFVITPGGTGADTAFRSPTGLDGSWVSAGETPAAMAAGSCGMMYLDAPFNHYIVCEGSNNVLQETEIFISETGESADWDVFTPFGTGAGGNKGFGAFTYSPSLQRLVAVSEGTTGGFIRESHYSDDGGETWTTVPLDAGADHRWISIVWSNELQLFVTVSGFSQISGGDINDNTVAYSADGETWSLSTLPFTRPWSTVTWNGQVFIALIHGGTDADFAAVSSNAIDWSSVDMNLAIGAGSFRKILAARDFTL